MFIFYRNPTVSWRQKQRKPGYAAGQKLFWHEDTVDRNGAQQAADCDLQKVPENRFDILYGFIDSHVLTRTRRR